MRSTSAISKISRTAAPWTGNQKLLDKIHREIHPEDFEEEE